MKRGREEVKSQLLKKGNNSSSSKQHNKDKKKKSSTQIKQQEKPHKLEPKTKKKKHTSEEKNERDEQITSSFVLEKDIDLVATEDVNDSEKRLGKKELHKLATVKRIIDTIYGSDDTQLVIFIFNYLKYCGKEEKGIVSCSMKEMTTKLKQILPRLHYLLSKTFVEQHSKELNITEIQDDTIVCKKIAPYFSKKDNTSQEFKDRLFGQICSSFVGIFNVNSGDACFNIGNVYSNTNYFGLDRSKFVEYISGLLDNNELYLKKKTKNGFSVWNTDIKQKLSAIPEKKHLVGTSLTHLDYSDKLIIVSRLSKLEKRIWNSFMDTADQSSIFVVDTEWNFNDENDHGIRLLQISTLDVCLVLLIDFKQPIPKFLLDFFRSPKILKIGFSLSGDIKKVNNWLQHHKHEQLVDSNLQTDLNVNEHGWVEGDPLVLGLQKLFSFCAPKIYHKFENNLKYNDLIWNPKDMRPSTSKGNIRIEYAALDVLAGYYFFKHISNPASNLFRIKMQIPNFEQQIEERSKRVKENLMEFFDSGHHHYEDHISNKYNIPIKFNTQ